MPALVNIDFFVHGCSFKMLNLLTAEIVDVTDQYIVPLEL